LEIAMTMPLRAALYLRVSTGRQADNDLSIPDQRRQAKAYCASRGWEIVATERAERRRSHIADLRKRAAKADAKLKRLYDAIENGVADLSDPMLKDRIGELKATRDQARLDAERAEEAIDRAGPTITRHRPSRPLPGQPASACGPMAAAIAAITFARSLNGSKSIRKNCASWDRKAHSCARSSPLKAQKRLVLACPVLYRSGAPGTIRTSDPQIRSLMLYPAELRARFSLSSRAQKPARISEQTISETVAKERFSYPLRPQLARSDKARKALNRPAFTPAPARCGCSGIRPDDPVW
jgi:Resolvase, N terminal domain